MVEDLSLRGMKARTSCDFEEGCDVRVRLESNYAAPLTVYGRVKWTILPEDEGAWYVVGVSITKVRVIDWFKFIKVVAQIKKEVW